MSSRTLSVQQHIGRVHDEVGLDRLPLRDLTRDTLETIWVALSVHGGAKRGAASSEGPQELLKRSSGWLDRCLCMLQNIFMFQLFAAPARLKLSEIHRLASVGSGPFYPEPRHIERRKEDEGQ